MGKVLVDHYTEGVLSPRPFRPHGRHYPFHYDPVEQVDLMPYQISVFPQDSAAGTGAGAGALDQKNR